MERKRAMMMTMMSRVEKGNRDEGGGNSIRLQIELYAACWRDNDIYARQVCDVWPAHVCFEGGMGDEGERRKRERMRNGERQKLSRVVSSPPPSRGIRHTVNQRWLEELRIFSRPKFRSK